MISEMERLILKSDLISESNEISNPVAPVTQNGNRKLLNKSTSLFEIYSACNYVYKCTKIELFTN